MPTNEVEPLFLALLKEHRNIIYKVCMMYSSDRMEREDLVQDVIVNMWRAYQQFRGDSKPSTWIYRIALNTCISQLRKKQSTPTTISITHELESYIDEDAEMQARIRELYNLIGMLAPMEKAIIMLWLDEKSYDEIGVILGISKVNVGVKINRIKEKLRTIHENN